MVAKINHEEVKYVVKMRYLRHGISYMVRNYIQMSLVTEVIEKAQGHHWMSADNSYGNTGGWDTYHSTTILMIMRQFFALYQKYIGIDVDQNTSKLLILKPVKPPLRLCSGLQLEDIEQAKIDCGYQQKDFDQEKLILEICWSGANSRAIVAPTGFGKTYLFLVPILANKIMKRREGGKRRVSFLVLPYNVVAVEFEKRMAEYVNVIGVRNLNSFDGSIDLVVGTVESLTKLNVSDFFLNFSQNYGQQCQLYR